MKGNKTYLYFIGVGGIGMSALARYFNQQGNVVFGYDKTRSPLTDQLESEGITIHFNDEVQAIPEVILAKPHDVLVVYTPAIPKDHAVLNYLIAQEYEVMKRSQILGVVTRQTINLSVAGTHGKTTTSSMVAAIMQYSDKRFSAFLGGISANLESNYYYQEGTSHHHFSVTEADEFDRSFLQLTPEFAIITSTDADHLDIYEDPGRMLASYSEFASLVSHPEHTFYALNKAKGINGVSYSATDTKADYCAEVIESSGKGTAFRICSNGEVVMDDLYVSLPGWHNLENAVGASLMVKKAGVSLDAIRNGLKNFKGIKRRFEFVVDRPEVKYIDDYAHHPSELKAIISSVRKLYPNQKITAVFQPHLFTRTRDFMDGFAEELSQVDELILLPIYPARELPIAGVDSEALLQKVSLRNAQCVSKDKLLELLKINDLEILLTLGAGDIDRLVKPIQSMLE